MSDAFRDVLSEWKLPPFLTIGILLTAALYVAGWLRIRRTRPTQFTILRLFSFLSGLAVLWLAIASPMDELADRLLSAHMVEHLLLMSAVPPLLWLGLPVVPLLRGLPRALRRGIAGPLLRRRKLRQFGSWLVAPLVSWVLMNGMLLGWHVPAAYDIALENETIHGFEHVCFLGSSMLFWRYILQPWPAQSQKQGWGILLYLVSADVINTVLSGVLSFCGHPVYRFYVDHPNAFRRDPLEDQVLGAVIMWVLGSLAFLIPAIATTFRMLRPTARLLQEVASETSPQGVKIPPVTPHSSPLYVNINSPE